MPRHWFIKTKRGKKGPITSKVLVRLAALGKIQPGSGVSSDGEQWVKADSIVGLSFPDSKPKRWLVKTKFGEAGPFTLPKLRKLAEAGRIRADFAVSRDGKQWIKAKRVPGLKFPEAVEPDSEDDSFEQATNQAIEKHPPQDNDVQEDPDTTSAEPVEREIVETPDARPDEPPPAESQQTVEPPSDADLGPVDDDLAVVEEEADEVESEESSDTQTECIQQETIADGQLAHEQPLEEFAASRQADFDDHSLLVAPSLPHTSIDLTSQWAEAREAEYLRRFGPIGEVSRSKESGVGAIDVFVHPPSDRRPITTLVTSGMSDIAMAVPHGSGSPRAELILYVQQMHPGYITVLRALAQLPHKKKARMSYGSLMNNGSPPQPIFDGSLLDCYAFMIPNIESDFKIHETLRIDDDPLHLLWVIPITHAERDFVSQHGIQQFCQLLDQKNHSLALNPHRPCYVNPERTLATS